MNLFRLYIPGLAKPHEAVADDEQAAIEDALYTLGLRDLPPGTSITSEPFGDPPCSSAT
ncbi:hypothetical protein D3C71_1649580 [compost metagenome]